MTHFPLSPHTLVTWLQQQPAEVLTLILLVSCGLIILLMMRLYGSLGLMVYSSLAVVVANLQVQKATTYQFFQEPVALGTVVFSSIFLVSSILTEYYGKAQARKAVWISFTGMIVVSFLMLVTIGFKPAGGFYEPHNAMCVLFFPVPALIVASLIAYAAGQFNDIWIFAALSRLTAGRFLWFRSFIATLIGAFIDNLIFSTLAWMVFAPNPLPWKTVLFTYVLGTYILRVFIAFVSIPFVYLARLMVR
ncbi:MAG TPA: queuosine precursor transporter [Alphaproteobacteria bacterium]|nr:queuosine precursor transporter [Alphaproteobacteria bacterium]